MYDDAVPCFGHKVLLLAGSLSNTNTEKEAYFYIKVNVFTKQKYHLPPPKNHSKIRLRGVCSALKDFSRTWLGSQGHLHVCNVAVTAELSNISREGSELVSKKSDRLPETFVPLKDKFADRYKQMSTYPEMRQGA